MPIVKKQRLSFSFSIAISIFILFILLFLGSIFFAPALSVAQSVNPPTKSYSWDIQRIDSPKLPADMTDRSLRIDANGHPHIAYGGDYLYYAWHNGTEWKIETVDTSEGVGSFASLALDSSGNPHIAYYDTINSDLKYAHKTESGWDIQTIDSDGYVGFTTSIVLDANGNPHIAYNSQYPNYVLKYASWTGSAWNIQIVDNTTRIGDYPSLALDINGNPHISYAEFEYPSRLKYAKWTGAAWETQCLTIDSVHYTSLAVDSQGFPHISYAGRSVNLFYTRLTESGWQTETIDSDYDAGKFNSLALDSNDNPHISYYAQNIQALKYVYLSENGWVTNIVESRPDINAAEGWTFVYNSIALDSNDNPHISYFGYHDGILRYAKSSAGQWSIQMVDKAGRAGLYSSLALDKSGNPHISYQDTSYVQLKYMHWTGSKWEKETVDGDIYYTGYFSSLALDSKGYPHISYFDLYYGNLKYTQWTGSKWDIQTIEGVAPNSNYFMKWYPSLALDGNDNPHVSYFDENNTAWKYAHRSVTGWEIQTVERSGALYTLMSSLAIDSKGYPHIFFESAIGPNLMKYAKWTGDRWDSIAVAGGNGAWTSSLALDKGDNAHIAYCNYSSITFPLKLLYSRWSGTGWETQVVDYNDDYFKGLGWYSSLALDSKGNPHVAYYDYTYGNLKYAKWTGIAWDIQTVDTGADVGLFASLKLDGNDRPHIAYYDNMLGDLKYAVGTITGPDISASSPINFENVMVNETLDKTVTVRNDGVANLSLGSIKLPVPPFSIVGSTCENGMILAPSQNCSIIVRFAPVALGPFDATISIESNDADENPTIVRLNGAGIETLPYIVTTNPAGFAVKVDGVGYTSPAAFNWETGSTHTIEIASPQNETAGSRYVFSSWSDGGNQAHSVVTPYGKSTYTANLTLQYKLTASVDPSGIGNVSLESDTGWIKANTVTMAWAFTNPLNGYYFVRWSGDFAGFRNPGEITMNGPKNIVAHFTSPTIPETISVPETPSGPSAGLIYTSYKYSVNLVNGGYSNSGHQVDVLFDWGDGTNSGWISGSGVVTATKRWESAKIYKVKVRSRCSTHITLYSEWSAPLKVTVKNISLSAPNGNTISSGSTYKVQWEAPSTAVKFTLQYSINNGASWNTIVKNITGSSYDWYVPPPAGNVGKCLMKVTGFGFSGKKIGEDKKTFNIEVIRLVSPNGGEQLASGDKYTIQWAKNQTTRPVVNIKLMYTFNGGVNWITITGPVSADAESYMWEVPGVKTAMSKCKVKVNLLDSKQRSVGSDMSDHFFAVIPKP